MSRDTQVDPPMAEHPLLRALGCIADDLDQVAELDPTFLPTGEKAKALLTVQRQLAQLEGLRLSLLAVAGDVAEGSGRPVAGGVAGR